MFVWEGVELCDSPLPQPAPHSQFTPQQQAFGAVCSSVLPRLHGVGEEASQGPEKTIDTAKAAAVALRISSDEVIMTRLSVLPRPTRGYAELTREAPFDSTSVRPHWVEPGAIFASSAGKVLLCTEFRRSAELCRLERMGGMSDETGSFPIAVAERSRPRRSLQTHFNCDYRQHPDLQVAELVDGDAA
jgi:hypothetical protein